MNLALKTFIEEKGKELLDKNLYRNFVLHVCNLKNVGILRPADVYNAIIRIQKFISDQKHEFATWPLEVAHWKR